jgi:hypothetical protein
VHAERAEADVSVCNAEAVLQPLAL